jgi:hypothetical protein
LTGTIPNFNLPKIINLVLDHNLLTGVSNFNMMPTLENLDLNTNQLTGSIPSFNLPALKSLNLAINKLTGSIPMFNLPNLSALILFNNQLSGCLPISLKSFCGKTVNIANNPSLATQDFAAFCANNTGACAALLPDFRITNIAEASAPVDLANTIYRGGLDGFPVLVTVVNDGAATAEVLTTSVYISADTLLDSRDSILGVPLQSSGVGNFVIGGLVPRFPDGDYFIIGKTNSNNAILESNMNNNVFVLKTPKVKIRNSNIVDAAISINSSLGAYQKFSPISYQIAVINRGTTPLTNIKIEFKFPAKTVTGGTVTPSVGTWQEWCSGGIQCYTWTIPSLAINEIANMDVPLYILDATGPLVATAKVLSTAPADANANNNIATRTINPNTTVAQVQAQATQLIPIVIQHIAPNPSDGELNVTLESLDAWEVIFNFSNGMGQAVLSEKRAVEKGLNRVQFDVEELPQGIYFIQTDTGKGRNVPTKFVKL